MTSKLTITRERLEALAVEDDLYNYPPTQEELNALARMALSAMDNEPVAYSLIFRNMDGVLNNHINTNTVFATREKAEAYGKGGNYEKRSDGGLEWVPNTALNPVVIPLYRHAQSAPDRDQVRREHAEWSQTTFGNVGPVGPLKHLSKEALEAAAEPDDLSEWADMQFLLWDAQRRAGITDEQITQAMIEKLAVNKLRDWPEPKDGEPRLHIKEQPAPVVNEDLYKLANHIASSKSGLPDEWQDWAEELGTDIRRAAMLQAGNSPVIPDGYVMVPMRLTAENGAKGALAGEFSETKFVNCSECFGDDECETCDGSGRIEITVPVSWTNIKEIWAKGVEHFAAAPQEVQGE